MKKEAIDLLKQLIATPSFSQEESQTADILVDFLSAKSIPTQRVKNNVWACNKYFDASKPTLLLNSHHDTVCPTAAYTLDPFLPVEKDGKLFGLGSNDAGASVVVLIQAFCAFYDKKINYNLILGLSAEEEITGENGIERLLQHLPKIDCAIVGEPTQMKVAIAERGLMVLDCVAHGKAGHAARNEGDNALYRAMDDINKLRNLRFERKSPLMGDIKLTVTQIDAGMQHNVVPAECSFVVDIRPTDVYKNEELLSLIRKALQSDVIARSTKHSASAIAENHPLVQTAIALGIDRYVSPTTSDMVGMSFPAVKMGVGDSARSHQADEFIFLKEIEDGIQIYIDFLHKFLN
ncbi:MAG: M20 family metallo-hydrolase [Bacteroidales bacterium]|jgi:acetylornithine deacetylase|nr:M20 family metallo-hydrolase [Bacteroidales bacterium]